MRTLTFAGRTAKEILRDPMTLGFGLGFPVILLALLSAIQANIPVSLFEIDRLAAGVPVFGLSFMGLFSAMLAARDRESAFLVRLYATPMRAADFIFGYTLPMLPIALAQCIICFLTAMLLGLRWSVHILTCLLSLIPPALFFIFLGLLLGSVLNIKAVGGICGALLTNLAGWFSGIWFDPAMAGKGFSAVADALPFSHAVQLQEAVLAGSTAGILPDLAWVGGYMLAAAVGAVLLFLRQMRRM